jgi:LacI family transcriptional regulator
MHTRRLERTKLQVTIRDVAKLASVAPITVSRVVNGLPGVNQSTRERVNKAIAELNYVPNAMAKSLRSRQTCTIALVLTDITNPFWTTIARGVEDTAAQKGYNVIFCNTDEDLEKEAKYINILLQRRVDGIIIAASSDDRRPLLSLKRHNVPLVLIDRKINGFNVDVVRSDSKEGARLLTQHLINLGYDRIAMLAGPSKVFTSRERLDGYLEALQKNGIPIDDNLIKEGMYEEDGGFQFVKELLDRVSPPTAIVAANLSIAIGALRALREAGLRVPEDVGLVCFDDLPQASLIYPFLTVWAQRPYAMGVAAAELLLTRMTSKARRHKIREIIIDADLIIRKSCGNELLKNSEQKERR